MRLSIDFELELGGKTASIYAEGLMTDSEMDAPVECELQTCQLFDSEGGSIDALTNGKLCEIASDKLIELFQREYGGK